MALFQKSVIKKHLNNLDKEQVEIAYKKFKSNYNPAKIEQIKTLKEEEYQDGFLRDIFVDVFGYILRPDEDYNLQREFKNQTDGKKADAAIIDNKGNNPIALDNNKGINPLVNPLALAVIELKSTKTKDLTKVTQQAFNYKNNQPECKYVITSNFQKLRFYIDYANEYEEFDLFYLEKEDFKLLYLLLNKNSLFDNLPLKLKEETKFHEQEVSGKLYKDYSNFKRKLYENLIKNNPKTDKLTLFKKSQKLLDRFLFILFAEDSGLLPPNSISRVIDTYHKLIELDAQKPLYEIFKQYFGYMNIGRKGKTSSGDIPAYNGGLFYTDTLLDNLKIEDTILIDDLLNLSEYDFDTEIDVNILGHIFEHSLNEIEEITAKIEATTVATRGLSPLKNPLRISKRKKDGVFYTPKYITQYIVENTIGTLCNEKRIALNIEEIEFDGTFRTKTGKLSEKGKKLYNRLKAYKDWLISLKIIDPACGSGAFLNQALNFLIKEHTIIDDIIAELTNTPMRLFNVDKSILENNLFGVDINEESVEIAQLSLWLRTAQKGRKLSNLNNNIKCGNSLIDDPEITGDKAFHWQTEFPQVFKEKDKKAYHITTAIHDSRTSARMIKYKVRENREMGTNPYPNIIYFTKEGDLLITQTIAKIVEEEQLNVLAYNICADHIHLLLVCDIDEIPSIMQKIKGRTSYVYKEIYKGFYKGLKPLVEEEKEKNSKPLWQQKYSAPKEVTSQEQLDNTIKYIQKNRSKHALPEHSDAIKLLIQNMCTDYITATEKIDYLGGFDCVIGNPPYIPTEYIEEKDKEYLEKTYQSAFGRINLYPIFYEKGIKILLKNGMLGFITPYTILKNQYYKESRKFILENTSIKELIDFKGITVFEDAAVDSIIFILKNRKNPSNTYRQISNIQNFQSGKFKSSEINQSEIQKNKDLSLYVSPNEKLIDRITKNTIELKNIIDFNQGVITGANKKFLTNSQSEFTKKVLTGRDFNRYSLKESNQYLIYDTSKLHRPRKRKIFEVDEKILLRQTGAYPICFIDTEQHYTLDTVHNGLILNNKYNSKFLLCLLNSKLLRFLYENQINESGKVFAQVKIIYIDPLPIKKTNVKAQQPFIEKADKMLALNQQLKTKSTKFLNRTQEHFSATTTVATRGLNLLIKITKKLNTFYNFDFKTFMAELKKQKVILSLKQEDAWQDYFDTYKTEINQLQNKIQQTDDEIDKMVYKLYDLSDEEIKIVENSSK